MILLTDGSLLVHHAYGKSWYRLTPDDQGRYESGSWSAAINMSNTRQFFASGVLMDGRVLRDRRRILRRRQRDAERGDPRPDHEHLVHAEQTVGIQLHQQRRGVMRAAGRPRAVRVAGRQPHRDLGPGDRLVDRGGPCLRG